MAVLKRDVLARLKNFRSPVSDSAGYLASLIVFGASHSPLVISPRGFSPAWDSKVVADEIAEVSSFPTMLIPFLESILCTVKFFTPRAEHE